MRVGQVVSYHVDLLGMALAGSQKGGRGKEKKEKGERGREVDAIVSVAALVTRRRHATAWCKQASSNHQRRRKEEKKKKRGCVPPHDRLHAGAQWPLNTGWYKPRAALVEW